MHKEEREVQKALGTLREFQVWRDYKIPNVNCSLFRINNTYRFYWSSVVLAISETDAINLVIELHGFPDKCRKYLKANEI